MENNKNLSPSIRFKNFTNDWEQRKLKDISIINPTSKIPTNFNYVDLESVQGTELKSFRRETIETAPSRAQRLAINGDLFYQTVRPYQKNNYLFKRDDRDFVFSTGYAQLRPEIDGDFLLSLIQTTKFVNSVLVRCTGTSYPAINSSDLGVMPIRVPKSNVESVNIGMLFSSIDNTITLHQRKLENLELTKKSFLKNMFPKNNNNKPVYRFSGFSDTWELRKLAKIGKTQSGIGFPENEQGGIDGIPFFKVSDMNNIGNEHEMKTANNYVTDEQLKRKKWKPIETVPAVMFAKVGAAIMLNRKRIIRSPFLIDNNTMVYIFDDSWDIEFGKTLFETINLPSYAQVGALPSYNGSDIESIEITIPKRDEQAVIGLLFSNLDNLITLHHRKLEKLELMKKYFLKNMFI